MRVKEAPFVVASLLLARPVFFASPARACDAGRCPPPPPLPMTLANRPDDRHRLDIIVNPTLFFPIFPGDMILSA